MGTVAQVVIGKGGFGQYLSINLGFGFGVMLGVHMAGGISGESGAGLGTESWPGAGLGTPRLQAWAAKFSGKREQTDLFPQRKAVLQGKGV